MKIRISDLPPEGLTINEPISLDGLNTRLNEGRPSDIRFTEPPIVSILVLPTPDGADTRGKVKTKYLQGCGRCAEEIERGLEVELNFIAKPRPPGTAQAPEYEDDLGILFFEGEHLELEETIQECLILSLSPYWSPPVDGAGTCTICQRTGPVQIGESASPAGSAKLGDLFKKAGLK